MGSAMKTNKSKTQNKLNASITKVHGRANSGKLQHTILCHNYEAM